MDWSSPLNYTYGKALTNSLGQLSDQCRRQSVCESGRLPELLRQCCRLGSGRLRRPAQLQRHGRLCPASWTGTAVSLRRINRVVDEAIGGWKISAAGVAYSGFPETITGPGNNSNSYGNSRAEPIPQAEDRSPHASTTGLAPIRLRHPARTRASTTGACAFGVPAPNTFGNAQKRQRARPRILSTWTCRHSRTSIPSASRPSASASTHSMRSTSPATAIPILESPTATSEISPARGPAMVAPCDPSSGICSSQRTTGSSSFIDSQRPERSIRSLRFFFRRARLVRLVK